MPRAVNGLKQCSRCKETKPVSEYNKDKNYSDGLQCSCNCCRKQYRAKNREKLSEYFKQYYTENKEKIKEQTKQYRAENKEKISERSRQYHAKNREKRNEQTKQYRAENKEKILEQNRQYHAKNKERISEQKKQYRQRVIITEPYVYIATDRSTGYFYIGRTTNIIKVRIRQHAFRGDTGLGKHMVEHNLTLDDLEIKQHHCLSVEESTVLEKKLIAENIDNPLCLNEQIG